MSIEERRRNELFAALSEAHGSDNAETLFAMLPPADTEIATRQDIERLEAAIATLRAEMDQRFAGVNERFVGIEQRIGAMEQHFITIDHRLDAMEQHFITIDQRFDGIDHRFTAIDQRFDDLREHIKDQSDLVRSDVIAAFRGEIIRSVATTIVATAVALGGLAIAFAQLL